MRDRRPGEVDHLVDDPGEDGYGERCREAGEASQQRVADAVYAVAPGPQHGVAEGAGLHYLAADLGDRLLAGGDDLLRQRREVEVRPEFLAAGLIA